MVRRRRRLRPAIALRPVGDGPERGGRSGLPLIATEAAGAAHDLIEEGVNGFRVPADDSKPLAGALRQVAEDEQFRLTASDRSRQIAKAFTPAAWAAAVAEAARSVS